MLFRQFVGCIYLKSEGSVYDFAVRCVVSLAPGGGGVLLGILGGGVPPGSSNPDPISDLNMPFSTPIFRLDF